MMVEDEERTPEARERAERALASLVYHLGADDIPLIVLGGLVPEVLTEGQEDVPAHLGTTDVDMLLSLQVNPARSMAPLERALLDADFHPEDFEGGWRWRGRIDGYPIKLEFLCDLETERTSSLVALEGCQTLKAMNLRGTGYVAEDWRWRELAADLDGVGRVTVKVRFAGLEGYLLSKCVAVRERGAPKDYYDLVYVLIHNREGGPLVAAQRLRTGAFLSRLAGLRSIFVEVRARFADTGSYGARRFAEQMRLIDFETSEAALRAQAVTAVDEFISALIR